MCNVIRAAEMERAARASERESLVLPRTDFKSCKNADFFSERRFLALIKSSFFFPIPPAAPVRQFVRPFVAQL